MRTRTRASAAITIKGAAVFWFIVACAGLLGGCNRGDPHQVAIEAASPATLAKWRMKMADRFTPGEWKEFEGALQDIRLRVMADREASGSAAVEAATCGRINGHTLREVLAMGYEARLARLRPVRDELKRAVEGNELLVTKPGDRESVRYLETLRERQLERLRKTEAEIAEAEQRRAALGGAANATTATTKTDAGDLRPPERKLTRESALAEIRQLMRDQVDAAVMKYGAWPVKMDRDGAALTGAEREDFLARRKAAAENGHTVFALRLRNRWWIFDEKVELPGFSKQVLGTLTDADRKEIVEEWAGVQAVIWARRTAFEEAAKEAEAAKKK